MARLAFAAAPGRVALVTDARAAAVSGDGDYELGSMSVTVRGGHAVLTGTDTIAGSTLTQDLALSQAIDVVGVTPSEAVAAMTIVPARALGLGNRFGLLEPGYAADAVVLDDPGQVTEVWADGTQRAS